MGARQNTGLCVFFRLYGISCYRQYNLLTVLLLLLLLLHSVGTILRYLHTFHPQDTRIKNCTVSLKDTAAALMWAHDHDLFGVLVTNSSWNQAQLCSCATLQPVQDLHLPSLMGFTWFCCCSRIKNLYLLNAILLLLEQFFNFISFQPPRSLPILTTPTA